jgi:formylglycine-generating enzyme required for sulfatase activity
VQHQRRIGRRFAISTKEVTKAQWRRFSTAQRGVFRAGDPQLATVVRTDDSPMVAITWYEVAWYCNWLSEQEGIPEDQWCYQKNDQGHYAEGMTAKPKFWELTGYRLPTEGEWEFACRAGTVTSRSYGLSEMLLARYAWTHPNADGHTRPVGTLKPNDFGLFDMHGNVYEWCDDWLAAYDGGSTPVEDPPQRRGSNRVYRGGGWSGTPRYARSAYPGGGAPGSRPGDLGFRPARSLSGSASQQGSQE